MIAFNNISNFLYKFVTMKQGEIEKDYKKDSYYTGT